MRDSTSRTIIQYLNNAQKRLELEEITEDDLKKVREHLENANEEIQKLVEDE